MGARLSSSRQPGPPFDPARDIGDLSGKVAMVTGGNDGLLSSGLGYAIVQHLARKGAKVYLAARNRERALGAIARLKTDGLAPGNGQIEWLDLDLSSLLKVKHAAEDFLKKEMRLDILVHNAGVMRIPYRMGPDGIQENMLVNHLSPFVLTRTLLPLLTKTALDSDSDVRIVMLTSYTISFMNQLSEVRFRSFEDFNRDYPSRWNSDGPLLRYSQSKLANVLYAKQLQKRVLFSHPSANVTVMSVDPGSVYTEGCLKDPIAKVLVIGQVYRIVARLFFSTPSVGAYGATFVAAAPAVKMERAKYMGAYIVHPGTIATPPARMAEDEDLGEELWDTTEALLRELDI